MIYNGTVEALTRKEQEVNKALKILQDKITKSASFSQDLTFSHKESLKPYWLETYKRYFNDPHVRTSLATPLEKGHDSGVDKIVFSKGHYYTVDEKFHKNNGFKDDKLHIEVEHVTTKQGTASSKPGWIKSKEHLADYLVYFKESTNTAYVFPFKKLQEVWTKYEEEFTKGKTASPTPNEGYISYCYQVSAKDLIEKIGGRDLYNYEITLPLDGG